MLIGTLAQVRRKDFLPGRTLGEGVASFSPLSLAPAVWFDPSDLTTLFQDAAGTTPVTADGDPVGRINDKSGNGRHATQGTSTARPLYKASGGLFWLQFDGVDDVLPTASVSYGLGATASTMMVAGSLRAATGDNSGVMARGSGGTLNTWRSLDFDSAPILKSDVYGVAASKAIVIGTKYVWEGKFGPDTQAALNGGAFSAVAATLNTVAGPLYLGASITLAKTAPANFYGGVEVPAVLTAGQRASLVTYLGAQAGLTL